MSSEITQHDAKDTILGMSSFEAPPGYKPKSAHVHSASSTSTRTAIHKGRKITIRTTYRIEIDGEPLMMHVIVMPDGKVHCHGLPNYSFSSAVDMARAIVDTSVLAAVDRDELGGGHDHGSDHGGHH